MRAQTVVSLLLDSDELSPEELVQSAAASKQQHADAVAQRADGPAVLWWAPHLNGFQGGRKAVEMSGREAYFSTLDDAVQFAADYLNPDLDDNIEIWVDGGEHIYSLEWDAQRKPIPVETGY